MVDNIDRLAVLPHYSTNKKSSLHTIILMQLAFQIRGHIPFLSLFQIQQITDGEGQLWRAYYCFKPKVADDAKTEHYCTHP